MEQPDRMRAPLVSVVMPVFNAQRYVAEAVESILKQTWPDLELLVIDDGSTDESSAIVRSFGEQDVRVHVISRPRRGLVVTLNEGLAEARGEFIARMDADDVSLPDRLERQIAYLVDNPDCVVVGSSILWVDPDGAPIQPMPAVPSHEQITEILLRGRGGLCHPAIVVRKTAALAVGGYRPEYEFAEDVDFFLRLGECGRLANLQECLLKYRLHFNSICATRRDLQETRAQAAVEQACLRRRIARRDTRCYYPRARTEVEIHRYWSHLARQAGFLQTARKHALLAVRQAPLSIRSWGRLVQSLSISMSKPLL